MPCVLFCFSGVVCCVDVINVLVYLSAADVQTATTASARTLQTTASGRLLSGKYHNVFITSYVGLILYGTGPPPFRRSNIPKVR